MKRLYSFKNYILKCGIYDLIDAFKISWILNLQYIAKSFLYPFNKGNFVTFILLMGASVVFSVTVFLAGNLISFAFSALFALFLVLMLPFCLLIALIEKFSGKAENTDEALSSFINDCHKNQNSRSSSFSGRHNELDTGDEYDIDNSDDDPDDCEYDDEYSSDDYSDDDSGPSCELSEKSCEANTQSCSSEELDTRFSWNWIIYTAAIALSFVLSFVYTEILIEKYGLINKQSDVTELLLTALSFAVITGILLTLLMALCAAVYNLIFRRGKKQHSKVWLAIMPVWFSLMAVEFSYIYNAGIVYLEMPKLTPYLKEVKAEDCNLSSSLRVYDEKKYPFLEYAYSRVVGLPCYSSKADYKNGKLDIDSQLLKSTKEDKNRKTSQQKSKKQSSAKENKSKKAVQQKSKAQDKNVPVKQNKKAEAKNQKKALSTPKKVEYIKSELKKAGYNVKVNQEWDTKTREYVSDLFKKRGKTGVNVNSICEVYENM